VHTDEWCVRGITATHTALQGLHPSNMFACGVDFLLRLKPVALAPHAEQFQELVDPAILRIGLHIRVGDQQLVRAFRLQSLHGPPFRLTATCLMGTAVDMNAAPCTQQQSFALSPLQVERRGTAALQQFEAWFDCAAQIEEARRTSAAQVGLWCR
jgi:hypothetical protein